MCKRLLNGIDAYGDTFLEKVTDEFYKKYASHDGELYDISGLKNIESDDFTKAVRNSDESIDVFLRYYNGGCGFSEAFETAMDKLNRAETSKSGDE